MLFCLNWLSGALVGVGGSDIGYEAPAPCLEGEESADGRRHGAFAPGAPAAAGAQ